MDEAKIRAYRVLLAQGLLHLKWDLACLIGGFCWFQPRRALRQFRSAYVAAIRAYAFHNLAISSIRDFDEFSEEQFWTGIERFAHDFPDVLCPYHDVFERCVRGEMVHITAPDGVGRAVSSLD